MKKTFSTALLAAASFAAPALLAHGDAEHVMGFARVVSADSVTVEDAAHKMITVGITAKTEVKRGKQKAAIADLKVGDRVMIHAEKEKDGKLSAEEVEIGTGK